jgi:hypothetical protein
MNSLGIEPRTGSSRTLITSGFDQFGRSLTVCSHGDSAVHNTVSNAFTLNRRQAPLPLPSLENVDDSSGGDKDDDVEDGSDAKDSASPPPLSEADYKKLSQLSVRAKQWLVPLLTGGNVMRELPPNATAQQKVEHMKSDLRHCRV